MVLDETTLALAQLVAYSSLTLMGLVVAAVSLYVSFRNSNGHEPVQIVTLHGMSFDAKRGPEVYLVMGFEVWNRRKYPISFKGSSITYRRVELDYWKYKPPEDNSWHLSTHQVLSSIDQKRLIEADGHTAVHVEVPMTEQRFDILNPEIEIKSYYFDPRKKRTKELTLVYRFKMSGMHS